MPIVTIRHATVYRYARPVGFGDHRLMRGLGLDAPAEAAVLGANAARLLAW